MLALGLGSMQYVLDQGQQYDWFDDGNIRLFTALAVAGLGGVRVVDAEVGDSGRRSARAATAASLRRGVCSAAVLGVSLYGSILVLPQYLQNSLGFTATLSGLTILVRAAAVMLFTPITAMLAGRGTIDVRISTAIGFVLLASRTGFWPALRRRNRSSERSSSAWSSAASAFRRSSCRSRSPCSAACPIRKCPSTSAFFNLSRQVGGSIATAVLVTLLVRGTTAHQTELAPASDLQHAADGASICRRTAAPGRQPRLPISRESSPAKRWSQSYADTSRALAVITILLAPLVLLLNKPRLGAVAVE